MLIGEIVYVFVTYLHLAHHTAAAPVDLFDGLIPHPPAGFADDDELNDTILPHKRKHSDRHHEDKCDRLINMYQTI